MMEKFSDIFRQAATQLERRGWVQSVFLSEEGVCARGALGLVCTGLEDLDIPKASEFSDTEWVAFMEGPYRRFEESLTSTEHDRLAEILWRGCREVDRLPVPYGLSLRTARKYVSDWNDAEGRTMEDVILAFKTAAVLAEEDEDGSERR